MNAAFVLRLTWDSASQHWRVLLRPTDSDDARLFSDIESAFFYVEMLMTEQVQKHNDQVIDASPIS
jgi:hypothetical protein